MTVPDSAAAACTFPVFHLHQAPLRPPATLQAALLGLGSCALASAAQFPDEALEAIGDQDALDLAGLLGCLDSADTGLLPNALAVSADEPPQTCAQQRRAPAATPVPAGDPRSRRRCSSALASGSSGDSEGAKCNAAAARARVMALVKQVPKAEVARGNPEPQGAEDSGDQADLDHTTAQERRRMKRRASNRESARRVRERRCHEMEALEARHSVQEEQQQRLLGTLAALQAQKAAMAGQLQELRGQNTQALAFNASLVSEVAALRGALAAHNGILA